MYIKTSTNNHGKNVFVSFERTDIFQINSKTFCYNRYSILNNSLQAMGRFRIQLLLEGFIWRTRYNLPKIVRYSDSSTQWTTLSLNFIGNYCIK